MVVLQCVRRWLGEPWLIRCRDPVFWTIGDGPAQGASGLRPTIAARSGNN